MFTGGQSLWRRDTGRHKAMFRPDFYRRSYLVIDINPPLNIAKKLRNSN